MINKKNLTRQLQNHARMITFTKANGAKRVMHATLNENDLRPNTITQMKNPDIITVFDVKSNAPRSIRLDSITEVVLA